MPFKAVEVSPTSSMPFAVVNNRVSVDPKGFRVENGSGRVNTSRILVQPNDEVVVALPFPYSYVAGAFFLEILAFFFYGDVALAEGDSPSFADSSFSVSSLAVFFNALLSVAFTTLFLFSLALVLIVGFCS